LGPCLHRNAYATIAEALSRVVSEIGDRDLLEAFGCFIVKVPLHPVFEFVDHDLLDYPVDGLDAIFEIIFPFKKTSEHLAEALIEITGAEEPS
jgi:hypothetical protein